MKVKKIHTEDHCYCLGLYGGEEVQDAYLELDLETGNLIAEYSEMQRGGVSGAEFNNRVVHIPFHAEESENGINSIMDAVEPLCQIILDDSEVDWDGSNFVGTLGPEASAALEKAREIANQCAWDPMDTDDDGNLYYEEDEDGDGDGDEDDD